MQTSVNPWDEVNELLLRPLSLEEKAIWASNFSGKAKYEWIEKTLRAMNLHYMVFWHNAKELILKVDNLRSGPLPIDYYHPGDEGQAKRDAEAIEICRLLTNFLASMNMLIDTTSRIMRHSEISEQFYNEYKEQIKTRFHHNQEAMFLKALRNFSLHRALPVALPEIRRTWISETRYLISLDVVILIEDLLAWKKLSTNCKNFILSQSKNMQLSFGDLVARYTNEQKETNIWWFKTFRRYFDEEVSEMNRVLLENRNKLK